MILNVYIRFKMFSDVMFTHESWATTKSLLAKLSHVSKKMRTAYLIGMD